ncbi:MAG: hypothetical protein ACFE7R_06270, partial [Candidatus Hodarchaeota archaeon]
IVIALIDEYAHTSSGVLIYFDLGIPSLLTVMGWSLFILLILTGTEILARTTFLRQIDKWEAKIQSGIMRKAIRALPALIAIVMIVVLAYLQLYIDLFSPLLIGVYIALAIGSLYYSHLKSIGWNLSILVVSVVVGLVMELLGGIEGMWWYYYLEPMAWFMMFTWALRTWTILTCCSFLRVRFEEVL